MGDMREAFDEMKAADKERKRRNLERAESSEVDWVEHTDVHWSTTLQGDRLDYWPSTTRFRWRNRSYQGGVEGFIRKRS